MDEYYNIYYLVEKNGDMFMAYFIASGDYDDELLPSVYAETIEEVKTECDENAIETFGRTIPIRFQ